MSTDEVETLHALVPDRGVGLAEALLPRPVRPSIFRLQFKPDYGRFYGKRRKCHETPLHSPVDGAAGPGGLEGVSGGSAGRSAPDGQDADATAAGGRNGPGIRVARRPHEPRARQAGSGDVPAVASGTGADRRGPVRAGALQPDQDGGGRPPRARRLLAHGIAAVPADEARGRDARRAGGDPPHGRPFAPRERGRSRRAAVRGLPGGLPRPRRRRRSARHARPLPGDLARGAPRPRVGRVHEPRRLLLELRPDLHRARRARPVSGRRPDRILAPAPRGRRPDRAGGERPRDRQGARRRRHVRPDRARRAGEVGRRPPAAPVFGQRAQAHRQVAQALLLRHGPRGLPDALVLARDAGGRRDVGRGLRELGRERGPPLVFAAGDRAAAVVLPGPRRQGDRPRARAGRRAAPRRNQEERRPEVAAAFRMLDPAPQPRGTGVIVCMAGETGAVSSEALVLPAWAI